MRAGDCRTRRQRAPGSPDGSRPVAGSGGETVHWRMSRLALAAALVAQLACAEADWPKREVHVFVGFSAGGTTDIITRLVGNELSKSWSQPIVVENRAGATGNIAAELVARAKPDGYTLLMGSVGPLAINASLFKSLPYDNLRDLAPVSLVAHVPNMLVVNPRSLPAASFAEFLATLKANPGKYFFASTGSGTSSQLSAELLKMEAGLEVA